MFKNILVPIHLEYKRNHKKLFEGALTVLDKEGGKITVLNVDETSAHPAMSPILDKNMKRKYEQNAIEELKVLVENCSLPMDNLSICIKHGSVYQEILEEAERINADAIVMMATKPGLSRYFISSTAERVVRHTDCSVFIIRLNQD